MRKAAFGVLSITILVAASLPAARPDIGRFQKLSAHCYYLESKTDAANTSAVITDEGVLLIDPPPESDIPALMLALKTVTSRTIRWVVNTDYRQANAGGAAALVKQGAAMIAGKELDRLASAAAKADPGSGTPEVPPVSPRFLFGRQVHLFPAGIEVRILAIKGRARTAGDVVVFLPSEKVLMVGDYFSPGNFPAIDSGPGEGSALGWIDGMKQVIDAVPLLKSAMPQPKVLPPPLPEQEKTLEELVLVVPARGAPSNLQLMKDLLAAAQKLRMDAARAAAAGRTRETFLSSLSADVTSAYGNVEPFAALLFDELAKK